MTRCVEGDDGSALGKPVALERRYAQCARLSKQRGAGAGAANGNEAHSVVCGIDAFLLQLGDQKLQHLRDKHHHCRFDAGNHCGDVQGLSRHDAACQLRIKGHRRPGQHGHENGADLLQQHRQRQNREVAIAA